MSSNYPWSGGDTLEADDMNELHQAIWAAEAHVVAGGSSNAFTLSWNPAVTSYTAGQIFRFTASHSITGSATVNVNTIGALTIKKMGGRMNLQEGDIVNGQEVIVVVIDGSNCEMIVPSASQSTFPSYQSVITTLTPDDFGPSQVAISPDGKYAYFAHFIDTGTNDNVRVDRFIIDPISKILYWKDSVTLTEATYGWDGAGIGVTVGSTYVWICGSNGSNVEIVRLAADLTSPQAMTISGTAYNGDIIAAAGDDSNLYLKSGATANLIVPYSISGTTATRGTNITLSSGSSASEIIAFDGTYFYHWNGATLNKYNASGTLQSATDINLSNANSDMDFGSHTEITTKSRIGISTHIPGSLILIMGVNVNETTNDEVLFDIYRVARP